MTAGEIAVELSPPGEGATSRPARLGVDSWRVIPMIAALFVV
jgi:hypothetical protein